MKKVSLLCLVTIAIFSTSIFAQNKVTMLNKPNPKEPGFYNYVLIKLNNGEIVFNFAAPKQKHEILIINSSLGRTKSFDMEILALGELEISKDGFISKMNETAGYIQDRPDMAGKLGNPGFGIQNLKKSKKEDPDFAKCFSPEVEFIPFSEEKMHLDPSLAIARDIRHDFREEIIRMSKMLELIMTYYDSYVESGEDTRVLMAYTAKGLLINQRLSELIAAKGKDVLESLLWNKPFLEKASDKNQIFSRSELKDFYVTYDYFTRKVFDSPVVEGKFYATWLLYKAELADKTRYKDQTVPELVDLLKREIDFYNENEVKTLVSEPALLLYEMSNLRGKIFSFSSGTSLSMVENDIKNNIMFEKGAGYFRAMIIINEVMKKKYPNSRPWAKLVEKRWANLMADVVKATKEQAVLSDGGNIEEELENLNKQQELKEGRIELVNFLKANDLKVPDIIDDVELINRVGLRLKILEVGGSFYKSYIMGAAKIVCSDAVSELYKEVSLKNPTKINGDVAWYFSSGSIENRIIETTGERNEFIKAVMEVKVEKGKRTVIDFKK